MRVGGRRVGGVREWGFGDNVYPYQSLMQLLVIDTAAYVAYVKMRLILAYLAVYLCQYSLFKTKPDYVCH